MKYRKILDELNDLLDAAAKEQQKQQEKLQVYLGQLMAEEHDLRNRLNNESNKDKRWKLKQELGQVKTGYEILESNLQPEY